MFSERSWADVWEKARLDRREAQAEEGGWVVDHDHSVLDREGEEDERDGETYGLLQAFGLQAWSIRGLEGEEKEEDVGLKLGHWAKPKRERGVAGEREREKA